MRGASALVRQGRKCNRVQEPNIFPQKQIHSFFVIPKKQLMSFILDFDSFNIVIVKIAKQLDGIRDKKSTTVLKHLVSGS